MQALYMNNIKITQWDDSTQKLKTTPGSENFQELKKITSDVPAL